MSANQCHRGIEENAPLHELPLTLEEAMSLLDLGVASRETFTESQRSALEKLAEFCRARLGRMPSPPEAVPPYRK